MFSLYPWGCESDMILSVMTQITTDNDEDISILEEDNSQIYAHLNNV